ncbi:MAG: TolC family protein [Clostridiales bacterium]|nr:TolC family protein [Clostridiales bacterium]
MNKRGFHAIIALVLALSFVLLIYGSALAKDTAQLDYAEIATRVPKENKNLDILQRNLPLLQKNRDDMSKSRVTTNTSDKAMNSLYEHYYQILHAPEGVYSNEEKTYAQFMLQSLSMSALAASSQGSVNFNSIDMQIEQIRIQILQTEAQLINSGQQLFYNYYKLQDNIKKMQSSRVLLEENLKLAKTQLAAGLGTALAVQQAELSIFELDTGIKQLESQISQLLSQLKLIVGWPQIQIIKLGSLPKPNREFFGKIDLASDMESACTNSYTIKSKQAEYKYTEDKDRKNLLNLTIEAQKEQISLAISTQYLKIEDANSTLLLEEQRLAVAEEKIKQNRLQHQLGLLSELAWQAEENNYNTQQEAVKTAMDSLFWEIENYKAMVAGLN